MCPIRIVDTSGPTALQFSRKTLHGPHSSKHLRGFAPIPKGSLREKILYAKQGEENFRLVVADLPCEITTNIMRTAYEMH